LLIIAALLLTQRYIRKKKLAFRAELEHMQLEHKAINALLNPHFLFNVVNNIQDLINTGSRESANNYLATMSKMIRQNMENLQFNLIPVINELELISNYIRLQNLRYQDRIQLVLTHGLDDPTEIVLPPLLLHTFVENAIIHGFRPDQPVFTIQISISLTINDYLSVQITDDGQGLPERPEQSRGKTSLGIDFNRKRLQRISEFYKVGFHMDLQNRTDGQKGAAVNIILYARFARLIRETQSGSSRSL
jgi:LytS/YehU family sensor histidine kinase